MHLDVYYSANQDFKIIFEDQEIEVLANSTHTQITYSSKYNYIFTLKIQCFDPNVMRDHIRVDKLVFDDYWTLEGPRLNIGKNVYDTSYLEYTTAHNIPVNLVNNNCTLFFMGELVFEYTHPIQEFFDNNLKVSDAI